MKLSKKKILILGIVLIALILIITTAYFIMDYIDYYRFIPIEWKDGDVSKWQENLHDNEAYALGLDVDTGKPVFKDPFAALEQFPKDYEDVFEEMNKQWGTEIDTDDITKYL